MNSTAQAQVTANALHFEMKCVGYDANFKVEQGPALGCVKLTVDSVNGAESYRFEYAPTPVSETTPWTLEIRTARSLVIQHLTSGQQYAFRAAGIGAEPIVVYSDVVTSFVL